MPCLRAQGTLRKGHVKAELGGVGMSGVAVDSLPEDRRGFCRRKWSNGFIAGICEEMQLINDPFTWKQLFYVFQSGTTACFRWSSEEPLVTFSSQTVQIQKHISGQAIVYPTCLSFKGGSHWPSRLSGLGRFSLPQTFVFPKDISLLIKYTLHRPFIVFDQECIATSKHWEFPAFLKPLW